MEQYKFGCLIYVDEKNWSKGEQLARSVKRYNSGVGVFFAAAASPSNRPTVSENVDGVVDTPFGFNETVLQNWWQTYWCTPTDHTLVLDACTLLHSDISELLEYLCENYNVAYSNTVQDYRGVVQNLCPSVNREHNLHTVYAHWMYMDKSDEALAYSKLLDIYCQNRRTVMAAYLDAHFIPEDYDHDLIHTLAVNHMGNILDYTTPVLRYTDMRTVNRAIGRSLDKWTDYINVWQHEGYPKIQNHVQTGLIAYGEDISWND